MQIYRSFSIYSAQILAYKITTFPPTFQFFSQKKLSTASPPYTLHLTPAAPLPIKPTFTPQKKAVTRLKLPRL